MQILEKKRCKNCGAPITSKGAKVFCSVKCLGEFKAREWKKYLNKKKGITNE